MYAFVVLLRLSRQTAFEPLCQKQFPSRPNNLWRNPPPNIRYLYVSYDQIDVIPPWKAFQRDADASGAGSAQEPVEWEQRGQACSRSYVVCGFKKGIQDNWILSPFINVSEAESISIYLEFTMSECDPLFKGQCQVIFDMYTYQTSNQNLSQSFVNKTTFKQDRITALTPDGTTVNKDTRHLRVTSEGLYLAFRDTGSCMQLLLVEVKHYVCPDVVTKLARFPQAQSVHPDTKIISGQCVDNARSTGTPQQGCKPYGQWNEMVNSACECLPGYEIYKNKQCRACLPGFYKDLQGNMNCSACPEKSSAKVNGSLVCLCDAGYDRATEDPSSVACTTFPSEPLNLTAIPINATAVHVFWSPPRFNGGRSESDLSYRITVKNIDNVLGITNKTKATISGLSPFANIRIIVCSVNGISQKRGEFLNTSSVVINMPEAEPGGPPENVFATLRSDGVEVTWKPPSSPNGIITNYTVRYFVKGSGKSQTRDVIHVNNNDLQSIFLTISTAERYLYQVRAATKVGYGSYSLPIPPQGDPGVTSNSNSGISAGAAAGVTFAATLTAVVLIFTIVWLVKKNWKGNRSYNQARDTSLSRGNPRATASNFSTSQSLKKLDKMPCSSLPCSEFCEKESKVQLHANTLYEKAKVFTKTVVNETSLQVPVYDSVDT